MATVVVTDGEQRAALAVVRSLFRAGHHVVVTATTPRSLAGASRAAAAHVVTADPLTQPGSFVEDICATAQSHRADAVFPITEAANLALLPARESFRPAVLPGPGIAGFARAADKAAVLGAARRLGMAVPASQLLQAPGDLPALAPLRFPVVIKPARSVGEAAGLREKFTTQYAEDAANLARLVQNLSSAAFPVLVQERIVGPGVGVFLLRGNGRILARFVHRRLREKPPSGGVSVLSESLAAAPELMGQAEALLEALEWEGVAMVEFKVDAARGQAFLMEVNGRFWGSLQLAIDAGVDFPVLLLESAMGEPPRAAPEWRAGRRSRWFWGDVDHLLLRLFKPARKLALPPGSPSRLGACLRFFDWRPWRERDAVFRWSDPAPFFHETAAWFRALR